MRILGIDSATWLGSVAVEEQGRILAEVSRRAERSHAETLPAMVQSVLEDAGVSLTPGDAIAVSHGPGSFTGLRIGMSLAKGLALAVGAAVVGVPTLDALAVAALPWEGRLCACLDARKREVYAAIYERRGGRVVKTSLDRSIAPEELARGIEEECTFVGDAVCVYGDLLAGILGERATLRGFDRFHPRGSAICRLARIKLEREGGDDLETSEPQYVRPPEAEVKLASSARSSATGAGAGVDNEKVVYYEVF